MRSDYVTPVVKLMVYGAIARYAASKVGRRLAGTLARRAGQALAYEGGTRLRNSLKRKLGAYVKTGVKKRKVGAAAPPQRRPRPRRGNRWVTRGHFEGRFRRPTRRAGRSMDQFNKKGWSTVTELTGDVTDADCCYLLNASVAARDVLYWSLAATVRKLFEIAGGRPTGVGDTVFPPTGGATSSSGMQVYMTSINLQTGLETASLFYDIVTATTFANVVDALLPYVEGFSAGFGQNSDSNMEMPYQITLMEKIPIVPLTDPLTYHNIVRAQVIFNETTVTIGASSQMKVQNRTKATGGSEDAENINNNPLQGRLYYLTGLPKPKNNGKRPGGANSAVFPFERLQYPNELSYFGAASGGFDPEFREPPSPGFFYNCGKSSYVRLEPGNIKTYTCYYKKTMLITKLWRMVRLQRNSVVSGDNFVQYSAFPCQMIGLEDVINANAAENISIQFEVERKFGAFVTVRKNRWTKTHLRVNDL